MLSLWLIYRLGRRLAGEQVGLVAAGLGAVYAYFVYYDAALMTEAFFTLGVLASFELSFALVGIDKPEGDPAPAHRLGRWLLLGVVFGVTALLRQTLLLWLPVWLAWVYWAGGAFNRQSRRIRWYGPLVSMAVMMGFILPWTVRNYAIYGSFLPLNSNAGYAFYSANHPNHGTQFDQDYAAPLPEDLVNRG